MGRTDNRLSGNRSLKNRNQAKESFWIPQTEFENL